MHYKLFLIGCNDTSGRNRWQAGMPGVMSITNTQGVIGCRVMPLPL